MRLCGGGYPSVCVLMLFSALISGFLSVVQAANIETVPTVVPGLMDPNTVSNCDSFRTTHAHLGWLVDFEGKQISGEVSLDVERVGSDATLKLDASDLDISDVQIDLKTVNWEYKPEGGKFGGCLEIEAPQLESFTVKITYKTTDKCTALQWLSPAQTSGKIYPFMFSQCQSILARTLLPCQDTPLVKFTYSADVRVAEPFKNLRVLMSANESSYDESDGTFKFKQTTKIPSYLIAIGVGNLASQQVGPRSRVWSEPELLEAASYEFERTEQYLEAAESLLGPYVWSIYDILVLPPSFPYGGMENPCLTFVTPSLLAGDRSLVSVVIHEITHSWTGNLVTNASWEHFWLNEGFTKFIERKLIGRLEGEPTRELLAQIGQAELRDNIEFFAPDDAYSRVPYEKGHAFLYHLEQAVGGPANFDPYLKAHIAKFAGQSIDSAQWKAYLFQFYQDQPHITAALNQVDFDAWLGLPGYPPAPPKHDQSLMLVVDDTIEQLLSGSWENVADQWNSFTVHQKVMLFDLLDQKTKGTLNIAILEYLDSSFNVMENSNVEIGLKWFLLCIHNNYKPAYHAAARYATMHGRMKYCRPVLRDLSRAKGGKELATSTYLENKSFYHPQATKMIETDLCIN